MEQKPLSFKEALQYGQEGEHIVAALCLSQSFSVMTLYQFTASTAPLILCNTSSFTSPDLMLWKQGKSWFAEVKRKNQWVRFDGNVETGLNYRHYLEYKSLSDKTGIPCILFFIQENEQPTGIYIVDIHNTNTRYWKGMNNDWGIVKQPPMLFFTSESLTRITN